MAACAWTGHTDAVIPLFLGAIASALAETDDSWRGRLRAQLVTLGCFAGIAFAVEAAFGMPLLFIAGLALAAFWLTMLGAVEARYKAIAYATLILAMYATLGIENMGAHGVAHRGREPLLLVAGAAWYGVFSVLWCAAFPAQPVQARLVTLFTVLGNYVRYKASLFEPLRGIDIERKRLALAQLNAEVVTELNAAKESIFRRIGARAPTGRISRYRGLYLIAQDVHERASSSHDDYNALADAFFHSDLLYRCQRVLGLQGLACQRLAESVARREPFEVGPETVQALADLRSAIEHERARQIPPRGSRCWPRWRRWRATSRCSTASSRAPASPRRALAARRWACSTGRRAPGATPSSACAASSPCDRRSSAMRCGCRSRWWRAMA